jgi:asparagine synthase (glutamine-hydrolysing)
MCGICGFYGFEDSSLLNKMMDSISHRGPDQHGTYSDRKVMLGHRRLNIIDLSEKGRQPMSNENGTVWIVFNGEIYNYKELRKELEGKGHHFASGTDTETIVHGYEEFGEDVVLHINGDFAFAIWDQQAKKLFLARDRIGVKPLYYAAISSRFLFASEIKALLQYEELPNEMDYSAVSDFFTFRFVPGDRTGFKDIFKLLPGHSLSLQNGRIKIRKYWDISFSEGTESVDYYAAKLQSTIKSAVESQLMSDVPLGAFIGGGIDSASIIASMADAAQKPIQTFTMGFSHESEKFNEYSYADIVARHFNTEHHRITVEPDSVKLLPEIIWYLDEPMADPSVVTQYVLAREAKKKVTVVLSGEGGDEVFGGYEQYRLLPKAADYSKMVPDPVKRFFLSSLCRMFPNETFFEKLKNFALSLNVKPSSYTELISIFDAAEKKLLFSEKASSKIPEIDSKRHIEQYFANSYSLINKMLLADIKMLLPNNLLMNVDKLGLAYALEGRVPLLDRSVVEFASSIPSGFKVMNGNEKFILKKAMQHLLPAEIVARKKRRFHVPIDTWYAVYLKDFSTQILNSGEFLRLGLFSPRYMQKLFDYQKSLSYNMLLKRNMLTKLYYARQIWNITVFALWHRIFIENGGAKPKKIGEMLK